MMKKFLFVFIITTLHLFAQTTNASFFYDFIGMVLPIVLFFTIWIFLAKKLQKSSGIQEANESNLKLAQANLEVASQLKRIADILEKRMHNEN